MNDAITRALRLAVTRPSLDSSRRLEAALREANANRVVFGRLNQKASLEANSESDRGIAERLANAFDASLTSAKEAVGIAKSSRALSPRKAAQRFFNPNPERCEWKPQDKRILESPPVLEFWLEGREAKMRHRKYQTSEGLCAVLVADSGVGIPRTEMSSTILALNSEAKLETFEAIGQFGHGGSSSLAFCESVLIASKTRGSADTLFSWTLVVPEPSKAESKQELVRYWFADEEGLPFSAKFDDCPEIAALMPGTAIWHFGYSRGGWIKTIAGPEQTNPWGRLGRLFFSYPLPFQVRGALARADTTTGQRLLKGAYFRLVEENEDVEYRSGGKSDSLILQGTGFGEFHVHLFVLKEGARVRNYVDPAHPIVGTLNGQNHGEMTRTLIAKAGLPELSSSMVIEIRLDNLDTEAHSNIITNSREAFKGTEFTRVLQERLLAMLEEDEQLQELELRRQEEKAREASADMSKRLSAFLSEILSDASGRPGAAKGAVAPGKTRKRRTPLPEIPQSDPPLILEFAFDSPLTIPEGTTKLAKFKSDARPPKYSFHGDNPRLFAELRSTGAYRDRVSITGRTDLNPKGYGSIGISCLEDPASPIPAREDLGSLHLFLQSASGRTLHAEIPIAVEEKPIHEGRVREPSVRVEVRFSCADPSEIEDLKRLFAEDHISEMGSALRDAMSLLSLSPDQAAYAGDRTERYGESFLRVEINASNPGLRDLMAGCKTAEERMAAKDRYCRDVVLDCYQHEFELETVPEAVTLAVTTHAEEHSRVAEIYLNHDKAVRFARAEREKDRGRL